MGPQWHNCRDRENSLLGQPVAAAWGGNDLDIALALRA